MSEQVFDDNGFDVATGMHRNGTRYDDAGFSRHGSHRVTGTFFSPVTQRTREGELRDRHGYDYEGFDVDGFDSDGYDSDGYDREGYDADGDHIDGGTRCSRGECEDCDCNCRDDFDEHLMGYGSSALEHHGFRFKHPRRLDRTLYAGHEIEMYSRDHDPDDVTYCLSQLRIAYRAFGPQTDTGGVAIATHDGSLDSGGFEIQTVPLTRVQCYGIFEAVTKIGDGRCRAWTCGNEVGHHIHLSRAGLTEFTIAKMGVFLNDKSNRSFVDFIAQRPASYNGYEDNKSVKSGQNYNRHSVFNTRPSATVEFRMFKSNLLGRGILKNYDFAMAMAGYCKTVTYQKKSLHWAEFLRWLAGNHAAYPYLHEFVRRSRDWRDAYVPFLPANARKVHTKGDTVTDAEYAVGA